MRCQSGTSKAEIREIIVKSQFATSLKSNFYSGQEGVRRKPVVYTVAAGEMQKNGYVFYQSINGVWLTKSVLVDYLWKESEARLNEY